MRYYYLGTSERATEDMEKGFVPERPYRVLLGFW